MISPIYFFQLSCFSNIISRWYKQNNSKRVNCFKLCYLFSSRVPLHSMVSQLLYGSKYFVVYFNLLAMPSYNRRGNLSSNGTISLKKIWESFILSSGEVAIFSEAPWCHFVFGDKVAPSLWVYGGHLSQEGHM